MNFIRFKNLTTAVLLARKPPSIYSGCSVRLFAGAANGRKNDKHNGTVNNNGSSPKKLTPNKSNKNTTSTAANESQAKSKQTSSIQNFGESDKNTKKFADWIELSENTQNKQTDAGKSTEKIVIITFIWRNIFCSFDVLVDFFFVEFSTFFSFYSELELI